MHKYIMITFISLACFGSGAAYSQALRATTTDGRQVILNSDGTWQFARDSTESANTVDSVFVKPASSTDVVKMKGDRFEIWYDPSNWILQQSQDPDRTQLEAKNGDVYAIIIAESFQMTMDNVREMALNNALKAAPDAQIIYQQYRNINGRRLLCMEIAGTINSVKFVYYNYYYSGPAGLLQLITFTSANLFPHYKSFMTNFLNGIIIHE